MTASLLVLAVMLPLAGLVPMLLVGGRSAERIALAVLAGGFAVAGLILAAVIETGAAITYMLGGWRPPLGVALRADGLSASLVMMTAVIAGAVAVFALAPFGTPAGAPARRAPFSFWVLLLSVWSALNLCFLAQDLFTLYVALELLTFGAVPLVCLEGKAETLVAALRYLLFALIGSMLYLLGAVLLYGNYGALDFVLLAKAARADLPTILALALMTVGLLAKAALFPLHLWLPPAHAGAPAAASALLSAVVIKAPIFLVIRLWSDLAPSQAGSAPAWILAALGACAIVICGVFALCQARLKLLIAYSTAAQIGYIFLMFPLASAETGEPWSGLAWSGGTLHLIAHALSKAAMFMAAGLIAEAVGHDRIAGLGGIGRAVPMSVFAFGLGGLSLMGLPPSGGFVAKVMLLTVATREGAWLLAAVILAGGLLAGAYVLRLILPALSKPDPAAVFAPVARHREAVALALALCAVALGFVPLQPFGLLAIGRPGAYAVATP